MDDENGGDTRHELGIVLEDDALSSPLASKLKWMLSVPSAVELGPGCSPSKASGSNDVAAASLNGAHTLSHLCGPINTIPSWELGAARRFCIVPTAGWLLMWSCHSYLPPNPLLLSGIRSQALIQLDLHNLPDLSYTSTAV